MENEDAIAKKLLDSINFIDITSPFDLHKASENGDVTWAKELLSQGVRVNKPDDYGYFPLHYAVAKQQL